MQPKSRVKMIKKNLIKWFSIFLWIIETIRKKLP
jgi:hypothetical protein